MRALRCMYWISLSVAFTVYVSESQSAHSPLGTPQNLRETSISDTSITIQWEPVDCSDCNGNITGYNVTYHHQDSEIQRSMTVVVTDYSFTAMGLLFDAQYLFEVRAFSIDYDYGPPASITVNTSALQGIVFVLRGQSYHEHSVVSLNSNGDRTMHCHTNKTDCCGKNQESTRRGNWILPNRSPVQNNASGDDFYRNGESGVLNLFWRMNVMIPMGMFCCEIPQPGPYQKACIGVYPENQGIPMVEHIVYDSDTKTVNCTSSGGPATDVYWSRNGNQINISGTQSTFKLNQRIIFTENATYENVLHIPEDSIENYNATYNCLVSNSRGNSSSQMTLEAIQIEHGNLSLGSNANLTCTTIIPVNEIKWLNSNGEIVASDLNTDELSLTFNPVNASIHNKQFTCTANNGSVSKTVTLSVVQVVISADRAHPSAGQNYTLTCNITGAESFNPNITYKWMKDSGTEEMVGGNTSTLFFSVLSLSNASNYICIVRVSFSHLADLIISNSSSFGVTLEAPSPNSVLISRSYNAAIFVGSQFNLTCMVNLPPTVDVLVNVDIRWSRSTLISPGPIMRNTLTQYTSTAMFVSNTESEGAEYQCTANVSPIPPHITRSKNKTGTGTFRIVGIPSRPTNLTAVPRPNSTKVSWGVTNEDVVLNYKLQYTYSIRECENVSDVMNISIQGENRSHDLVNLPENSDFNISLFAVNPAGRSEAATIMITTLESAPVGTPQQVTTTLNLTNITILWNPVECLQRNGEIDGYRLLYHPTGKKNEVKSIVIHGSTNRSFTIVGLQPRVNYTLRLLAVSSNYTLFGPYAEQTVVTSKPNAVGFLFHGRLYGNNSIVTLTDIGENDKALLCITNINDCCKGKHLSTMREWYYPNGSSVRINNDGDNFYRNRDPSVVRLNRRNDVTSPTGIYRCEIPDDESDKVLHIGIYNPEGGSPTITSFRANTKNNSLVCISRGGPATKVIWMKDDQPLIINGTAYQQTQTIVDSASATYENTLISDDRANFVGTFIFTCIVENDRGRAYKSLSTNGVVIKSSTGSETFTIGRPVNLSCTSDSQAKMEWLKDKNVVVVSMPTTQQLNLSFTIVNDSIHNKVYICRVTREGDIVDEQNITITVRVPPANEILDLNIDAMGQSTAGQNFSINCTVSKKVLGIMNHPDATWIGAEEQYVEKAGQSAVLRFNRLNTSQGKNYTCQGTITSLAASEMYHVTRNYSLIVYISKPNVTLDIPGVVFFAGTNLFITCIITLSTEVDSDITVDVSWFKGNSLLSNESNKISVSSVFGKRWSFTSTLLISPLTDLDNATKFKCKVSASSDSMFVGKSVIGESFANIHVQQKIPSAPRITDSSTTSTSIYLAWSQQPDDFIKRINVTAAYTGPCFDLYGVTHITSLNSSSRQVNLTGLEEYSNYSITVAAFNDAGSNLSQVVNITTNTLAPSGPPNGFRNSSVNLTTVTVGWDPVNCSQQNSIIKSYIVYYKKNIGSETIKKSVNISTPMTAATIPNLDPHTEYVFEVQATNDNGYMGPLARLTASTSVPEVVGFLFRNHHYNNNSIVSLDDIGEGSEALFCLTNNTKCCKNGSITMGEWYFPNSSELQPFYRDDGMYRNRGPSVVRLHRRSNDTMQTGIFHCEIPDASGTNQTIYIGLYLDQSGAGAVSAKGLVFDKDQQALTCISSGGPPTTVSWIKDDKILTVDGNTYRQTQTITNSTNATFMTTIFIKTALDQNKIVGNYSCIVNNSRVLSQDVKQRVSFEIQGTRITGHQPVLAHGSPVSLNCTTDLTVDIIEWMDMKGMTLNVGNDSMLELLDMPRESGVVTYTCKTTSILFGSQNVSVNVQILPKPKPPTSGSASVVIPVIVLIFLLLTLVLVVIVIIRRKNRGKLLLFSERMKSKPSSHLAVHPTPLRGGKDEVTKQTAVENLEMTNFEKINPAKYRGATVSLNDFCNYVKRMHEDRDEAFETEYSTFSTEPQKSHAVADIEVNRLRNRFINIFPYDHCRVKLKEFSEDDSSDYINASYMDGYQKPNAYIAAQGPLPNTVEDFWRMIWENRLSTIVMLTQCFEGRKKCECYWPENINSTFEPGQEIRVVLTSMTPFTEYAVRKMTVTNDSEPNVPPLEVTQFHFVAWPDHGVPDNCAAMLNFVRRVRKAHPYSDPNILLVHCSAGVGRTGTFIVLDSMMEKLKTEDTLNIYDFVKKLREQRVLMVQSLAQYIFIHDALKELILCGPTEISVADIRGVINQLSMQHDQCSASTGYEHQFQVLGQLSNMTEHDHYLIATSEHNKEKNRYDNKLPNNFYRVVLKSTPTPGSDYINASFIVGYRQRNAYIATQGPLQSTVSDFWRMVWEKQSICVVLLSKLSEKDKEMCHCYWPTTEEETINYGQIMVTLLSEENYGDYNLRQFEINENRASHPGMIGVRTAFTVTQFQFMVWPEHETPPITSSLIELIDNVNKVQMGSGNRPMIVMCNDGVGRTGTFICIHAQLERLKVEGTVDFFQFIKSARLQRAGLVSDSDQYALCHDVVADYLDSFDTYANFKEVT